MSEQRKPERLAAGTCDHPTTSRSQKGENETSIPQLPGRTPEKEKVHSSQKVHQQTFKKRESSSRLFGKKSPIGMGITASEAISKSAKEGLDRL